MVFYLALNDDTVPILLLVKSVIAELQKQMPPTLP
jgi:hypothetical protein